ncbi:MAG: hypothetical protein IJZ74_09845 [Clostridia bacterium]|nr:hypothetical protein [Clostridia bacterium]
MIRGVFSYAGMYNNRKDSVLDYVYSDAYFTDDARVYNPSLSTMSLALEMSSWSSLDEESWVNKSANARDLLTETGFVDYAQNDFWNDVPTVESIGVVAARKELEDSTLIALAVRGGGYFSEWGSNVLVGSADEHVGFATARDNVLSFLRKYIEDCGVTGRVKLWLVGFSRGGAVANMTAGYLNDHGLTTEASLVPADLYCYTFEAPQGVLEASTGPDAEYGNIHNIINPNDIVPLVAPDYWGFSRYNQTSHLLPTITTACYAQAREQMLIQYADILKGVEVLNPDKAAYNIAEYAKTLEMKINWLSFLPGGTPFIEIQTVDNTHLPQSLMLMESVSALVEAAKSRDRFHADIEADISTLLGELLGANKGTNLSDYIQALGTELTENSYANLIYILEPIVQLNFKSFEERMNAVAVRLKEIIPQPEGYTDIVGTVGSLVDVIATMLVDDPQAVLNLVMSLSSTNMIQAHYAEVTMAWLRTEDPNFTDTPFTANVPETVRIVRVNCPVDLLVYDGEGTLVASIIGGESAVYMDGIGCAVNPDGEMVIYLPADAEFEAQIIATGDGSVSCAINELNIVRGKHTFVVNYPDVPIRTGDTLCAVLPKLIDAEYTDEPAQGSTADYRLIGPGGSAIEPDHIHRGDDVILHTVKAERSNQFGQVLGGGQYIDESYAQLEAYPVSSSSFLGWYVDGRKVSSEAVYRFPVTQDVTVVAHFSDVALHQIRFEATAGGTVHNADNAYSAGSMVLLSATADAGYFLTGWKTSAGRIVTLEDGAAYLIVPAGAATVTAVFVEAGIVCPACRQLLPKGTHHLALCGGNGHFSCEPGYRAVNHADCTICGSGHVCEGGHGYGSGECGVYECAGCGEEILITENHASPCGTAGHWTCAADYEAAGHAICEHCSALLCNGEDHGECTICGSGHVCEGGHGYGSGECGVYECAGCGEEILITENHASPCGTAGHWTCAADYEAASHALCTLCGGGYVCDGTHGTGEGQCGYVEPTPAPEETPSPTPVESVAWDNCEECGGWIVMGETHLGDCGVHYTCADGYAEDEHALCTLCGGGYVCDGTHGTGEGQCSYAAFDASAVLRLNQVQTVSAARTDRMLPGLAIASLAVLVPLRRRKNQKK